MKRLLFLFCLAMSMLTQASAQGNNPYVLHIYDGRMFNTDKADELAAVFLNDKFEMTTIYNGIYYTPIYSRNGKKLFMGLLPNIYDVNIQQIGILNATVEDNFGFSFTQKEMSDLTFTALGFYTGIAVDFSKDNLAINRNNFPDENFRVFLQSQSYGKDYVLTPEEISGIKSIDAIVKGISSLNGIEYFTALTELNCSYNKLTSLDLSKNMKLMKLYCCGNRINGVQAENFVNSLPTVTGGIINFCDLTESGEKNEMTDTQVAKAKAKGWTVYAFSGSSWKEYAGTSTGIAINAANFPDANFRNYLLAQSYGADAKLTPEEISGITEINVESKEISSLKGIEYFTALEYLDGNSNLLTSLDMSKNTALKELYCYSNQLTSLDVSKNTALTKLYCYSNQLASLDVSKNTALKLLSCTRNQLASLNVSKNTKLTRLDCSYNELASLDVTKNTALTELACTRNQLASLDVSKNTALVLLYCELNQIKGGQAENLVNSLPKVTDGLLIFCDLAKAGEKNEMTSAQVAKAKAKGWTVIAYDGSGGMIVYEGTSTGIDQPEQAQTGSQRTYTLDGRAVSGQPTKRGIYIRGGKKVMVK